MRIPEFLSPGGGTSTRYKLNSLLSLPFILLFFYGLSLSLVLTLFSLSLSFAPILSKIWGMDPRGEDAEDKGG